MRELTINTGNVSRILLGESLGNLLERLSPDSALMVVDEEIARLHPNRLPRLPALYLKGGEGAKSMAVLERIYAECLKQGLDRSSWLVGIGGGTICDLTGFVAATFMRGIRCALAPTTLLAQVDASIGGKNGINFAGIKNIVGVIRQPNVVLCDLEMLPTVPTAEIRSGFAEVVKAALIEDRELFETVSKDAENLLSLKSTKLEWVIERALRVKAGIVERDETEQGERVKLNFGHTLGHAVEVNTGMSHGDAVSVGMAFDIALSVQLAGLSQPESKRIYACLETFGLTTTCSTKRSLIFEAARHDKKRHSSSLKVALLSEIGRSEVKSIGWEPWEAECAKWLDAQAERSPRLD